MFVRFLVPLKALSVNKMYRQFRGRTIKSEEAREFETVFNHHLAAYMHEAVIFCEHFDENQHAMDIDVVFYIEKSDYNTKSGRMSKRSIDVDNGLKCAIDQVFRFMHLDDGLIKSVRATKVPSDADCIEITVKRTQQIRAIINPVPKAMVSQEQH